MASATTEKNEKSMATDAIAPGADQPDNRPAERPTTGRRGFFTIYKKGQGYWTRMGTAAAALAISALVANFLYSQTRAWFQLKPGPALAIAAAAFLLLAVFAWRMMNKAGSVDFLIATDSEMKKVNWTTRKELIGSTKVVIIFVILISALLFVIDIVFGYLFHLIRVLEFGPFQ